MTRRQTARRVDAASVEVEVAQLRDLDLTALRLRWQAVMGRAAPAHVPRHLMLAMLAYRIQADAFGDLGASSVQLLKAAVSDKGNLKHLTDKLDRRNQELLPGAVLTREWSGQQHRVMVLDDGFAWQGKTYHSLSSVAFGISGTKWNGPRFFGLRSSVVAGAEARTAVARGAK